MNQNKYPQRKKNRLADYDYSENGAYFITICTKNREPILSRISVGADIIRPTRVVLTRVGAEIETAIQEIPAHYKNVFVDHYVIMPNHVHILLRIDRADGRMVSAPTVVGSLKRFVSKQLGILIWQKGFYDHVVRDSADYETKYQYIDTNPDRWLEDELYTREIQNIHI